MLDTVYYGNSIKDWGISAIVIISALIINKLIILIYNNVINKITNKSKTGLDEIFFNSLQKPLMMGVILLAIWISLGRLDLGEDFHKILIKSYNILITLNITWFVGRLLTSLTEHHFTHNENTTKHRINSGIVPLIKRAVLIVIWTIGGISALHNVGIQVTALIGTLGIGSFAFALASQDTIKNIFGGITLFTDKPFYIGDLVKFEGIEGNVMDIGLRTTKIRTYDKQLVTIPNYKLTEAYITNISSEPGRRIVMEIGLTYDTPYEKMQEALDILNNMPEKVREIHKNDLKAVFTNFGDSALVITFIYFIRESSKTNILDVRSKVNFEILSSFNKAGLNFAFPTQTVYVQKG